VLVPRTYRKNEELPGGLQIIKARNVSEAMHQIFPKS
jgi:hypothetical protein